MQFFIHVNGDLAFMEAIFTGLGHVFSGNSGMINVFKVALLVNCLMSMLKYILDPKGGLLTSFWVSLVVYLVMFTPTGTAVLVKPTFTNIQASAARPIPGQIPIGILYPAEVISTLGSETAQAFRDAFVSTNLGWGGGHVLANGYLISNYGLDPLIALNTMRQAYTSDAFSKQGVGAGSNSGIQEAIQTYLESCFVRYNKLATVTGANPIKVTTGINAQDAWSEYNIQKDWPIRFELNGVFRNTTCRNGHAILETAIKDRAKEISKQYLGTSTYTQDADASYAERLANTNSFLQAMTTSGGDTMHQMLSNQFVMAAVTGNCGDSVLLSKADVQICRAQFDQIQSRRNVEASKATGFKEMFIPMVTFMEGFVYLITPFILFVVLLLGVKGLSLAGKYLTALVWIVLMPICQVAVDLYLSVYFSKFLTRLQNDVAGSNLISMNAQSSVWTDLESFISFAGTAQAMVPTLAMFILFAGVHTLMGIASGGGNSGASQSAMGGNIAAQTKNGQSVYGNQSSTNLGNGQVTQKQSAVANDSDKVGTVSVSQGQTFQTVQQSTRQSTQQAQSVASAANEVLFSSGNENAYGTASKIARGQGFNNVDAHQIGNLVAGGMDYSDAAAFTKENSEGLKFDANGGMTLTGNVNEMVKQLAAIAPIGKSAKGMGKMIDYLDEMTKASPLADDPDRGNDWMPKFQVKMSGSGGWSVAQQDKGSDTWQVVSTSSDKGTENHSEITQGVKSTMAELTEQRQKTHKDAYTESEKAAIQANNAYMDAKSVSDAVSEMDSSKFDNSIQISDSAPTAANIGSDFAKIASGKHFEQFNNSLVNSFLSDDEKSNIFGQGKEFDFATATDQQKQSVLSALDDNERQTLKNSGFVKMSDDGNNMTQMTAAESLSKVTGRNLSKDDLDSLISEGTDDASRRTKSANRSQLLQETFAGVIDSFKSSAVNGAHRDELVSAAGSWFESAGKENLANGGQLGELARMGAMLSSFDEDNLKSAANNVEDMNYRGKGDVIESKVGDAVGSASRFKGMDNNPEGILEELSKMNLAAKEQFVGNPQLKEDFEKVMQNVKDGTLSGSDAVDAAKDLEKRVEAGVTDAKTNLGTGQETEDEVKGNVNAGQRQVQAAPTKVPGLASLFNTGAGDNDQRMSVIRHSDIVQAVGAYEAIGQYNAYVKGDDSTPGLTTHQKDKNFSQTEQLKKLTDGWTSHNSPEADQLRNLLGEEKYNEFAKLKTAAINATDYISENQSAQNLGAAFFNNSGDGSDRQLNPKLFNQVKDELNQNGEVSGKTLNELSSAYAKHNDVNAGESIATDSMQTKGLTKPEVSAYLAQYKTAVGFDQMDIEKRDAVHDYLRMWNEKSDTKDLEEKGLTESQIKDTVAFAQTLDAYNKDYNSRKDYFFDSSGSFEAKNSLDPTLAEQADHFFTKMNNGVESKVDGVKQFFGFDTDDKTPAPQHTLTGKDAEVANAKLNEIMYGKGLDPLGHPYK
ncbi:hypothetical protein UA32_12675 [Photobacterium angustum]|uniref:TraG N-terminal Proteobacteria domain-containing protein n=1 Tax=Photobacterium angustum TaxID=661 RepID=A0ABX5H151_PHOAN|nr:conjugal transfer protein TraG N-terminal domain-containing protein [Photobacterium angustum]KJG37798.1 hypothetical protein UA32_12675 [Photobacterium angustum]PSX07070.1 hypothetical protein C0W27_15995 [Photobacterium angustum]